ncbi:MAG: hypothetical protein KME19_22530 [Microcoleus vaginatus WJT46-NPBG5]|nr:hypothetical protein [Microcoleus vaginatus WJT46-NPBG5]
MVKQRLRSIFLPAERRCVERLGCGFDSSLSHAKKVGQMRTAGESEKVSQGESRQQC